MHRNIAAVSMALLCAGGFASAQASQSFDLTQNIDFTTWTLLGSATATNNVIPGIGTDSYLALTQTGTGGGAGLAYRPEPLLLDFNQPFDFSFRFFVAHGSVEQGDGMTFFITGTPMLGHGGSDLGYGGSSMNGYAFAVDTFNFSDEPEAVSVQILSDGSVAPLAFTETGLTDVQPANYFQWRGTVSYTPSGQDDEQGALAFSIYQAATDTTYTVHWGTADWWNVAFDVYDSDSNFVGRGVHIGFSAGSGLADDGHYVGSLTPIPEPETWALMLAGLGLLGWRMHLTRQAQRGL